MSDRPGNFSKELQSISEELEFLLLGLTAEQKKIVTAAYYGFAQGDKGGFAARFATLLQVHVLAMKTYPFRLRQAFAEQAKQSGDEINAQRAAVKQSAAEVAGALRSLQEYLKELTVQLKATRRSNTEVLNAITQDQINRDVAASTQNQQKPVTAKEIAEELAVQFVIPYVIMSFLLGLLAYAGVQHFWPR